MKKFLNTILTLIVVLSISLLAFGCQEITDSNSSENENKPCSILVSDQNNVVISVKEAQENQTLFDVMTSLKNDTFGFEYEDGPYGAFITSVNGRKPVDADYWAVYTSDSEKGNADYGTFEYDGKTLVSASFGISGLNVKANEIYAIVYNHVETSAITSATENEIVITVNFAQEGETLLDVMNFLKTKGNFDFATEDSDLGPFLTTVNGKKAEPGFFWGIYTTDEKNSSKDYSKVVNGVTYYSANLGISSMPVFAYNQYALVYGSF